MLSSSYDANEYPAEACIDSSASTLCASSKSRYAWLSVRVPKYSPIDVVAIQNRADCCQRWLSPFEVWVGTSYGDTTSAEAVKCGSASGVHRVPAGAGPFIVRCNGASGEFVTLRLTFRKRWLTIAELEVYAPSASTAAAVDATQPVEPEQGMDAVELATPENQLSHQGGTSNDVDAEDGDQFLPATPLLPPSPFGKHAAQDASTGQTLLAGRTSIDVLLAMSALALCLLLTIAMKVFCCDQPSAPRTQTKRFVGRGGTVVPVSAASPESMTMSPTWEKKLRVRIEGDATASPQTAKHRLNPGTASLHAGNVVAGAAPHPFMRRLSSRLRGLPKDAHELAEEEDVDEHEHGQPHAHRVLPLPPGIGNSIELTEQSASGPTHT